MLAKYISALGFRALNTRINILRKIASDDNCHKAYKRLLDKAQTRDILLESWGKDGVRISKLAPLEKDVVVISENPDFIKGIDEAIEKLEERTNDSFDINRCRLIGF